MKLHRRNVFREQRVGTLGFPGCLGVREQLEFGKSYDFFFLAGDPFSLGIGHQPYRGGVILSSGRITRFALVPGSTRDVVRVCSCPDPSGVR